MRLLRVIALVLIASIARAEDPAPDGAAAIALYRARKTNEARAAFERLFAADAKNAEAAHYLGLIALRERRDDDAVRFHEIAIALAPDNATYLIAFADACGRKAGSASLLSKLGWAKKCRVALEKAVALEPASYAANGGLVEFYRRAPGVAGGGMQKAYAHAEAFKKIDLPGGTQILTSLYRTEGRFTEIFTVLDEALKIHPDHYLLLVSVGRTAAESGQRLDDGIRSLERCLTLVPPPRAPDHAAVWYSLGNIRARQGDRAGARAAYEEALKLEPAHRDATVALKTMADQDAARP